MLLQPCHWLGRQEIHPELPPAIMGLPPAIGLSHSRMALHPQLAADQMAGMHPMSCPPLEPGSQAGASHSAQGTRVQSLRPATIPLAQHPRVGAHMHPLQPATAITAIPVAAQLMPQYPWMPLAEVGLF